ncbi:hypothetical protein [Dactylosporangium sp. CS-033363]|uniref:hypothetical protein n=1 Tax=Dactylosporangium sp. CS-033363 TaxID=3239935 RepID=UPI003D8B2882
MRADHPIDRLVATVQGTPPDSLRALATQLPGRRRWILGPPELVGGTSFVLSIHTARPPWDEALDPATDRAHLDEVKDLLGELCRISAEHGTEFAVDFAGEMIGTIEDGQMDTSLEVGLLAEWQRVLDHRRVV